VRPLFTIEARRAIAKALVRHEIHLFPHLLGFTSEESKAPLTDRDVIDIIRDFGHRLTDLLHAVEWPKAEPIMTPFARQTVFDAIDRHGHDDPSEWGDEHILMAAEMQGLFKSAITEALLVAA